MADVLMMVFGSWMAVMCEPCQGAWEAVNLFALIRGAVPCPLLYKTHKCQPAGSIAGEAEHTA
jgi:hypothetical protein